MPNNLKLEPRLPVTIFFPPISITRQSSQSRLRSILLGIFSFSGPRVVH